MRLGSGDNRIILQCVHKVKPVNDDEREGRGHVVGRDDLTDRGDRDAHGPPKERE